MKPRTIETIELSSACDLACGYCINPRIPGARGRTELMREEVFEASLELLALLVGLGTQGDTINLNGNGESLLDPDLPARVKRVKDLMGPKRTVQMATNGKRLTERLAMDLADAGLDNLEVSPHDPMAAARALHIAHRMGLEAKFTIGTVVAPHEWAGQHRWLPLGVTFRIPCDPLIEGRLYIQSDGSLVPCCYDFQNLSRLGSVTQPQGEIMKIELKPFNLCRTCHQDPPGWENCRPKGGQP